MTITRTTDDHADHDDHAHGDFDPHFWFDMSRMATVAELVSAELEAITGINFADCGVEISSEIRAAELRVSETLTVVPDSARVLVTDHDALAYFADKYDFEVVGVVIPGGSTLGEPSSGDLAELVEVIKAEGVGAIFGNSATSTNLLDALASEVGSDVQVVELFVGSLGDEASGANSYLKMMELNAARISEALTS